MNRLLFIVLLSVSGVRAQSLPLKIHYNDAIVLSDTTKADTLFGIPVTTQCTTIKIMQRVQTFCNYGAPQNARYETIPVLATVSLFHDSTGSIKTALIQDFEKHILEAEQYAASNHFKASVVPEYYFTQIDSLFVPENRPINSRNGNYVIWYFDGYVCKIELTDANRVGNLNGLLRDYIRVSYNGKMVDPDFSRIQDIEKIKTLIATL